MSENTAGNARNSRSPASSRSAPPPEQVWEAVTNARAAGCGRWSTSPRRAAPALQLRLTTWTRRTAHRPLRDPAALPPFQTLNQLDYTIEPRDAATVPGPLRTQRDLRRQLGRVLRRRGQAHRLLHAHPAQYVTHFAGRPVAFTTFDGPGASANREALGVVGRAVGLSDDTAQARACGPRARAAGSWTPNSTTATPTHRSAYAGRPVPDLRRGPWGAPVGISVP